MPARARILACLSSVPTLGADSNRCFPSKAVSMWLAQNDEGRQRIVSVTGHGRGGTSLQRSIVRRFD